jgi:DNA-binding NtrC family response regulator
MRPRLVLLYTRDRKFDRVLLEALRGSEGIVLTARNVSDARQIVSHRGRELDFAVLDLHKGCRGMTLLSAIHTRHAKLPTLIAISKDLEPACAVAYASGARACINEPLQATMLPHVIADLDPAHAHQAVA